MIHSLPPRPDPARADHAGFVRDVLAETSLGGQLDWPAINELAARHLRPEAGETSRLGHAFVLELAASGLVEVETSRTSDGVAIVSMVRCRRAAPRSLAPAATHRPLAA